MPIASPTPAKTLLEPQNHTLVMIDHQSQMAFATKSIDAVTMRNNAGLVAEAAANLLRRDVGEPLVALCYLLLWRGCEEAASSCALAVPQAQARLVRLRYAQQ